MSDPNLVDFYGRVARIQKARAKGYGFEAAGTLGRSHYHHPVAKRRSVVGPVIFLALCTFMLKGAMYQQVGAQTYNERVAGLMSSEGIERVGGWLMQADPVTKFVASKIELGLGKLK